MCGGGGVGSRESGVRRREWGEGSRERRKGSGEWRDGSGEMGVGRREWGVAGFAPTPLPPCQIWGGGSSPARELEQPTTPSSDMDQTGNRLKKVV